MNLQYHASISVIAQKAQLLLHEQFLLQLIVGTLVVTPFAYECGNQFKGHITHAQRDANSNFSTHDPHVCYGSAYMHMNQRLTCSLMMRS